MARFYLFLLLHAVFLFLLVPMLVIATYRSTTADITLGGTTFRDPFYSTFKGSLQEKRDLLIERFFNAGAIVETNLQRTVPILHQTSRTVTTTYYRNVFGGTCSHTDDKISTTPISHIRFNSNEDRSTNNYAATFREYLTLLSNDLLKSYHGLFITSTNNVIKPIQFREVIFAPLPADTDDKKAKMTYARKFLYFLLALFDADHSTKYVLNDTRHIGQMIGKAILNKHFIDVSFMSLFYKLFLNQQIYLADIKGFRPDLVRDLEDILNTDLSINKKDLTMIKDGSSIPVTNENKDEYVQHMADLFYRKEIEPARNALLNGLKSVISIEAFQMFNIDELKQLISGNNNIYLYDWKKYTRVSLQAKLHNHQVITWFWESVSDWDNIMHRQLLMFVTGVSQLHVDGFIAAPGQLWSWFNIEYSTKGRDSSPYSDPYKNVLYLPPYSSKKMFQNMLEETVTGCSDIWHYSATHLRFKPQQYQRPHMYY